MSSLFVNVIRGIKKRLLQYLGIAILIIIIISSLTSLYSNAERIQSAFYSVVKNSGKYDYRFKLELLNNYKDVTKSTADIKNIIKNWFPDNPSHPENHEIRLQIDKITESDIRNDSLPTITGSINPILLTYLLNWGINYQGIYLNNILETEVATDNLTKGYNFEKSFFKNFNYEKSGTNKLFFSMEDAFDLNYSPIFDYFPSRNNINKAYVTQGHIPTNPHEVIINPQFAKKNNIALNSSFSFIPGKNFKVVGFGYAYWGIMATRTANNSNPTSDNTTPVFFTNQDFNNIIADPIFRTSLLSNLLLKVNNNDSYFVDRIQNILVKYFSFSFGTVIISDTEDAKSGQLLETFKMQTILFTSVSLVVLLVVVFIVLSYVRKEIELQRSQVGLLKALGYSNFKISFSFVLLFFLITLSASIIGFGLGLPLQIVFNNLSKIGFFLPLASPFYLSIVSTVASLVIVPIIFIIATYVESMLKLGKSPLLLIYDRPSSGSSRFIATFKYPFRYWPFKQRLAIAFTLKSVGKLFLIFFTFIFVSFLLLFQTTATDLFDNKISTLYGYYNSDVKWYAATTSMYTYTNSVRMTIDKVVFDWKSEKDLVTSGDKIKYELKAHDFQIDDFDAGGNSVKLNRLLSFITINDFKGYYMYEKEMTIFYQHSKTLADFRIFVDPTGQVEAKYPDVIENQLYPAISQFFAYLISATGTDPDMGALPGIALGTNIYNTNYYPFIQTTLRAPMSWKGHNQGKLLANRISSVGLYNDANEDLGWKNWFNLKEEKARDIDPIFNNSHQLQRQAVTYKDNQGLEVSTNAYVVPAVISKALSLLNDYKINSQFLMMDSWYNFTIPVIFDVKGIISNNLDTSSVYANINDLRTVISLPLTGSFNYLLSKDQSLLPLNFASLSQPEAKYNVTSLQNKNFTTINKIPVITALLKKLYTEVFDGIRTIMSITKFLTLFAVAFVLIIVINMILDNNLMIIAMMKSLGYRVNEINRLIIGSYIIALVVAFILGTILSYVMWNVIVWIIAIRAGVIFNVPISSITILSSFGLVFLIMVIGYAIGLFLIKYKPITTLLQGS